MKEGDEELSVIYSHLLPPTTSTKPIGSDTMTTTTTTTNQYWMEFYQQQPLMDGAMVPPKEGFSGATTSNLTPPKVNNNNNVVSKPIRRRSRASKRTPTTLLNANTTNFRALVQQFTGCPSTTMSSLGVHKGPITLNFKHGSSRQHIGARSDHNQVHQAASAAVAQFPLPVVQQLLPQQQLFQEQHGGYSFDYMKSNNFFPTLGNSRPSMEILDGMVVGNDFNLPDLTSVNAFSNDSY
ncbi:hypothetical protein TanjilG_21398 [Lupinus angustifolius]|uniref:VQ domain-containing protein n=1 Tax=Lupinus angustifolius TaxID=3871 RepID=A0A4P1RN31_LUPAN|nr:PREDICTED: uncharacterized protein LOC109345036 [Lupinus angustifolius]OIW14258.1 hypothetical protein TanjilG_21398 [Lupinus angustifolius]